MLQIVVLVSLESSGGGGVHQLGSMAFGKLLRRGAISFGFMAFGLVVQKFLCIE
jgi:hypothetical protein